MRTTRHPKAISRNSFSDLARNSIADYIRELMEEAGVAGQPSGSTGRPGEEIKLPPEVSLADELGLSRATVRQALAELENEGMIMRIHGRGTYVNPYYVKMKLWLNPGAEFTSMIRGSGYEPTIETLRTYSVRREDMPKAFVSGKEESSRAEGPDGQAGTGEPGGSDEVYTALESVFYADGNPCIYCIDYFPAAYFTEQDDPNEFLTRFSDYLLEKTGKTCKREYIHMRSISAGELAEISDCRCPLTCASCLVHEGHFFDQNNELLFFSTAYFDTTYLTLSFISNQ